jgi:hypothetical protein
VRDEDVLGIIHDNQSIITRHISSATGRLSLSAVCRTLHENQLYPFHVQPTLGLQPGEKHLHLQYSRCVLHNIVETPHFLCSVLYTDEVVFTKSGVHNVHNLHA